MQLKVEGDFNGESCLIDRSDLSRCVSVVRRLDCNYPNEEFKLCAVSALKIEESMGQLEFTSRC